jgi:mono/diheme cytochrome c family protein
MKTLNWIVIFGFLVCSAVAQADDPDEAVDFMRDIRPILSQNCFTCHGPDEDTREAGLRLDQRDTALAELESGETAVVPGHPDKSELFARITSDDEYLQMPPAESGRALTAEQIELIRRWIEQGAPFTDHWAFQPPQRPELPAVRNTAWPRNEIDYFVLARLERAGIEPSPEADRPTLIRRLSLDLLGLPPTPAEVERFVGDEHPEAYERLVDRLLASPHFGERWGKHWLDLARYADSDGYLGDKLRPYAYLYRDWVIDAINRDLPFDQFTIEQLAGDLLPNASLEQKIATGFHRNAMQNTEAGADREEDRVNRTVNRVSTTGTVWLGLTVGCAECHTHKFDPISHHEFYQLYAFFNNADDRDLPAPRPEEVAKYERALEKWTGELTKLEQDIQTAFAKSNAQAKAGASNDAESVAGTGGQRDCGDDDAQTSLELEAADLTQTILRTLAMAEKQRKDADKKQLATFLADLDDERRGLLEAYEKKAAAKPSPPATKAPTLAEVSASKRRPTRIHLRGDFRSPGEQVEPGTLAVLHPLHSRGEQPDRLDLAYWLVDSANPLTHRTTVNHMWKHLFGRGLVHTSDNFGTTGETPSHPELLDWLALELVERQWSRKAMIRLIVNSATYRQVSHVRSELRDRDPYNILLARQSRYRLEAEVVRDLSLSVGGLLNTKIGGPSIRPPLAAQVTNYSRNRDWPVSPGAEKYRRGLYILFRRNTPFTMLVTFDAPDTSVSCTQRERTNSPLQALTLLNDPVFFECAQYLGRRLFEEAEGIADADTPQGWIRYAFRLCLAREPGPAELDRLVSLYHEQRELLADASEDDLKALVGKPLADVDLQEQAARVVVARSLMNVHEFITRE